MRTKTQRLIETCLEGGPLTEREIAGKLAGRGKTPEVAAMISLLEWKIGDLRTSAETTRGVERDEFTGAAREMRLLRVKVLDLVAAPAEVVEKKSRTK